MSASLLIVDDEASLLDLLSDSFRLSGYQVETATDGELALGLLREKTFDLVITDINMPKINGLEFIERLHQLGRQTPVIVLSAMGEKPDVTAGLRSGADDYVAKPFGLEELTLRVAAVLRRTMKKTEATEILECGPIKIDKDNHKVFLEDAPVELSPTEFALLWELIIKKGKLVTKSALMRNVWNIGFTTDSNVLATYISYLRKKLHTEQWQGLETVRGLGFRIVEKSE